MSRNLEATPARPPARRQLETDWATSFVRLKTDAARALRLIREGKPDEAQALLEKAIRVYPSTNRYGMPMQL